MKTLTIIAIYIAMNATSAMAQAPTATATGKYRSVEPIAFHIEKGKHITHKVQPTSIKPIIQPDAGQTATGQMDRKEEANKTDQSIAARR
jgi:hypothetical protein